MIKRVLVIAGLFFVLSCGKDTFESKPQLTLRDVSSTIVPPNGDLIINIRLTDKEGDFYDTVWVRKVTTRCPNSNFADSLLYRVPSEAPRTKNFDGELTFTFTYAFELQPRCTQPDTAVFSFWMKDEKGNVSDITSTPPIIILRP